MTAVDWHQLPRGHYAIPISDWEGEYEDVDPTGWCVIGWHVYHRTATAFRHYVKRLEGVPQQYLARQLDLYPTGADRDALHVHELLDDPAAAMRAFAALTGRCAICNRTLTDPDSKARGVGPDCNRSFPGRIT